MNNGETNGERRAMTGIALRWVHLVIAAAVYLVSIGAVWATMRTQLDQMREEVSELKKQAILEPQWKEFREDIQRRLDHIEKTVDSIALKKSLQDLSQ